MRQSAFAIVAVAAWIGACSAAGTPKSTEVGAVTTASCGDNCGGESACSCGGGGSSGDGDTANHAAAAATLGAFGAALTPGETVTPLGEIEANPTSFAGKRVRTEGTVAAVCQRRGCWMELRVEGTARVVRVPMAGHSFMLPRDSAGKHATVDGTVIVRALTDEERAHFAAEGSLGGAQPFSIEASGVVLR